MYNASLTLGKDHPVLFYRCLILQDLQTYAGPDAVQEWRKLLVSTVCFSFLLSYKKFLDKFKDTVEYIYKHIFANKHFIQKVYTFFWG